MYILDYENIKMSISICREVFFILLANISELAAPGCEISNQILQNITEIIKLFKIC